MVVLIIHFFTKEAYGFLRQLKRFLREEYVRDAQVSMSLRLNLASVNEH